MHEQLKIGPTLQHTIDNAIHHLVGWIMAREMAPVSYVNDLALEAVLRAGCAIGRLDWSDHVAAVVRTRPAQPWKKEPFTSLTYALAAHTRNPDLMRHFLAESYALRRELLRSSDGLVQHPRGESRGGGMAVLIDSFAEYVSRLCRATEWGADQTLAQDAADQVIRHEQLLVDKSSGLWRQGRGWFADPHRLSPGTWSRGQGWLMRGFADALESLRVESAARATVGGAFQRLADAVIKRQDAIGAWHALPHLPHEDSGPESSGTALIAYGLLLGIRLRLLSEEKYAEAARRALTFIVGCVGGDGIVHDACYGPGPLIDVTPWRVAEFPPGDSHGPGTVLLALVAARE
jgi:rhamnogalacturonyl hydrolase YesR